VLENNDCQESAKDDCTSWNLGLQRLTDLCLRAKIQEKNKQMPKQNDNDD